MFTWVKTVSASPTFPICGFIVYIIRILRTTQGLYTLHNVRMFHLRDKKVTETLLIDPHQEWKEINLWVSVLLLSSWLTGESKAQLKNVFCRITVRFTIGVNHFCNALPCHGRLNQLYLNVMFSIKQNKQLLHLF